MKYVDLFSGCGGLSLGAERAGGELVLAVEKSDMAARTFFHNLVADASDDSVWNRYLGLSLREQVESKVLVDELESLLNDDLSMEELAAKGLDIVVGGPPCQGFSLAGRRQADDVRNKLPWQYLQFVSKTSPRAVVIENVIGMDHSFSKNEESSFYQLQDALRGTGDGYEVQGVRVNAAHYGAPQHRPRLMIIGLRRDVAARVHLTANRETWRSTYLDEIEVAVPPLGPIPTITRRRRRVLGDAVFDLTKVSGDIVSSGEYLEALNSDMWPVRAPSTDSLRNHSKRSHRENTVTRFRLYQYLAANSLNPRLLNQLSRLSDAAAIDEASHQLSAAPVPAIAPDKTVLANSRKELVDLVLKLVTKKHSQKVLKSDELARTVVTLPDDYVHPVEPRIFTVREMARFQGFPDRFEFLGKETTGSIRRRFEVPQYSQVGNAVSPWLAYAVAERIASILKDDDRSKEEKSLVVGLEEGDSANYVGLTN